MTIWDALGVHCSANERRADEASRDVEAWLKCYFMQDKLGEEFTGMITGVTTFGIFVQLDELFVEGLVHVTELGTDYFQYDDARHELRGERTGKRYQLTDKVTVQVARVDLETRKIDLRLVQDEGAGVDSEDEEEARPSRGKRKGAKGMDRPAPPAQPRHEIKSSEGPRGARAGGRSAQAGASAPSANASGTKAGGGGFGGAGAAGSGRPAKSGGKRSKSAAPARAAAAPRAAKTASKSSKKK
jgi:ribonuclease R